MVVIWCHFIALAAPRVSRAPLTCEPSPADAWRFPGRQHRASGIIEDVTVGLEHLARTAYEAHRAVQPGSLPRWEDSPPEEQQAWKAAVSAVAGQTGVTLADAVPDQSLLLQAGDEQHAFRTTFTAGRQGALNRSRPCGANG